MQLHVKGKNLEVNDSIRRYAERKLRKLDRQLTDTARVEVELAVERNPSIAESQVAEATVRLPGRTLRARESSRDMKAAIATSGRSPARGEAANASTSAAINPITAR